MSNTNAWTDEIVFKVAVVSTSVIGVPRGAHCKKEL